MAASALRTLANRYSRPNVKLKGARGGGERGVMTSDAYATPGGAGRGFRVGVQQELWERFVALRHRVLVDAVESWWWF